MLGKICIFQSRHGTAPDDDELNAKLSMVASLNIGLGRTEIIFSGEDPTWCSRAAADLSRADPSNGNDLSYFHNEMFLPFNFLKKIFNTI